MKIFRSLIACFFALLASGCRKSDNAGQVDEWTWNTPDLKTITSPDKSKRARADLVDDEIHLAFGEAGRDHPVDIMIEHKEVMPAPITGQITMRWVDDREFIVEHPDLGTKSWTVDGVSPMIVKVKAKWHLKPKK